MNRYSFESYSEIVVESIDEIYEIIEEYNIYWKLPRTGGNTENRAFYRGQANALWSIEPSILRCDTDEGVQYRKYQSKLLGKNLFDQFAYLQHYVIGTRLIDFTINPEVALYFACEKEPMSDAALFLYIYNSHRAEWIDTIIFTEIMQMNYSFEEHYVSVPEQGGGKLIPEGMGKPGCLYTVSKSKTGMIGCYRLETQMMPGNGKLTCTGIGSGKEQKEATNTAFNYLKANGGRISGQISTTTKDYIINYQDMQGIGMTSNLAMPTLIAICSAALGKTPLNSLAVLGEISIGGTLIKVDELASTLQVCLDSGAKKVLLPITSAADLGTVPSDLVGAFSLIFYSSPEEAVYKALGVE